MKPDAFSVSIEDIVTVRLVRDQENFFTKNGCNETTELLLFLLVLCLSVQAFMREIWKFRGCIKVCTRGIPTQQEMINGMFIFLMFLWNLLIYALLE
jgi:hypothetical protein